METSRQWQRSDSIALATLLVTVAGVIAAWLVVPEFRAILRPVSSAKPAPNEPVPNKKDADDTQSKMPPPQPKATTQSSSRPTSQEDEQKDVHNSSGPVLSRQIDDFFLKMTECTPTGDPAAKDLAIRCVGSIENKGDFKIRVEFYDGRAIDDNGNEYRIWTTGPWGGVVANFYFGAGCCAQELISGVPVKFGFPLDHVKRDATSLSVVLDIIFPGSGGWSRREAVFKGVPIRGH
jgi:hypothetical protein